MFIIRDMVTGDLLGSPITSLVFWPGTPDRCEMVLQHGLEYRPGDTVLQKVYAIEETSEGEGSARVVGDPVYDEENDRVTRHTVRSKSDTDIALAATQWVRDRSAGYEATIFEMKGVPASVGDKVMGLGFVVDALVAEVYAIRQGQAMTGEFAELLTRIAAVKQANPKP
jgi:hypothetical protein